MFFFSSVCPCSFISCFLHCYRLSSPLPKKWESYGERGGFWKKGEIQNREIKVYWCRADAPIDWLMRWFAWSEHACVWLHTVCTSTPECTCLLVRCNLFAGPNMNLQQLLMFWTRSHTSAPARTLTAAATHLHDKGLVNYLRSLIWSIQESCIRLQGQSEPLDSIGLHYSWEPQRGTRREGGREKREGARDREQQQRQQGLVSCVLKVFLFRCWWIFYRVWNLDGTSLSVEVRAEGKG